MQKKRGTIAVILILALLILGIGYATLTSTLTISGYATALANDDNFVVVFANKNTSGATTTNEPSYDDTAVADTSFTDYEVTQTVNDGEITASFSVEGLTTEGDTVVLTFPIENRGIVDATSIVVDTDASVTNTEYFSITTSLSDSSVAVDGKVDAYVTVTCLETPTETQQSGTVTITIKASAE